MEKPNISLIFIVAIGLIAAAVVAGVIIALPILRNRALDATQVAILNTPHICLPGTLEKVERRRAGRYARYCEKDGLKHGSYVVWDAQRKAIEGQFVEGKQHGLWTYLDEAGRATRIVEYSEGKIVNDSGAGPRSQWRSP